MKLFRFELRKLLLNKRTLIISAVLLALYCVVGVGLSISSFGGLANYSTYNELANAVTGPYNAEQAELSNIAYDAAKERWGTDEGVSKMSSQDPQLKFDKAYHDYANTVLFSDKQDSLLQLFMRTFPNNPSLVQHNNLVNVNNGTDTLRHDNNRAFRHFLFQSGTKPRISLNVQSRKAIIKKGGNRNNGHRDIHPKAPFDHHLALLFSVNTSVSALENKILPLLIIYKLIPAVKTLFSKPL